MNAVERDILNELNQLQNAVQAMASANPKPNLVPIFTKLDELARQLPKDTDPTLVHYLHRKSYEKARLWLEGREAENVRGRCGH